MELKDYLHLYLGCEVQYDEDFVGILIGVYSLNRPSYNPIIIHSQIGVIINRGWDNIVKPILRPLSDITNEEVCEMNELVNKPTNGEPYPHTTKWARRVCYMLERHFDLFKLIEAGLAIDKTSLQQPLK
jgi:hypothetical protein